MARTPMLRECHEASLALGIYVTVVQDLSTPADRFGSSSKEQA